MKGLSSIEVVIRPLSPELLGDYLSYFESIRFREHPNWANCYCYSYHFTGPAEQWNRENNITCVKNLVQQGNMKGYLAYWGDRPVGWCNANNRLNYQRLVKLHRLRDPGHESICSVVCFVIHQDYRRMGVATRLLQRVISDYGTQGYEFLEAYPRKGERSDEEHYTGPLALYLANGFSVVEEYNDHYLVRLSPSGPPVPLTGAKVQG
jgi:GNAT superfamily N-acetyltransferase